MSMNTKYIRDRISELRLKKGRIRVSDELRFGAQSKLYI